MEKTVCNVKFQDKKVVVRHNIHDITVNFKKKH